MGSREASELEDTIKNIKEIEKKTGESFRRAKERIERLGVSDYEYKKALVYQKNYMKMLEDNYKNFEGYEEFVKELKKFRNPIRFYDYISQHEKLSDIKFMYSISQGLVVSAGPEEQFNQMLEEIGIEI